MAVFIEGMPAHLSVNGAVSQLMQPVVKHGNVAVSDYPFGMFTESGKIKLSDNPQGTISAP